MFDFTLFIFMVVLAIPGLLATLPGQLRNLQSRIAGSGGQPARMPSLPVLIGVATVQNLLLVVVASAVGTALSPSTSLAAPLLEAIVSERSFPEGLAGQLVQVMVASAVAMVPFLLAYYGVIRPRLGRQTVQRVESVRMNLGLAVRILYGGVVEEILFRWGLVTALAWAGVSVLSDESPAVIWAAILVAALLFGLGHLPSVSASRVPMTRFLILSTVFLNLYAGLLFGWFYWQYGLWAAMVGHTLFHLIWYPLDRTAYRQLVAQDNDLAP